MTYNKYIPRVYIAGPFRGPSNAHVEFNINIAKRFQPPIAALACMPVCVHSMEGLQMHDICQEDSGAFWLRATLDEMLTCDVVVVTPWFEESKGTLEEIKWAHRYNIPVFYSTWNGGGEGPLEPSHPSEWLNESKTESFTHCIAALRFSSDFASKTTNNQEVEDDNDDI